MRRLFGRKSFAPLTVFVLLSLNGESAGKATLAADCKPPYAEASSYAYEKLELALQGRGLEQASNRKFGMLGTLDLCAYAIHNTQRALLSVLKSGADIEKKDREEVEKTVRQAVDAWHHLQKEIKTLLNGTTTKLSQVKEIAKTTKKLLKPSIEYLDKVKKQETSLEKVDLSLSKGHWLLGPSPGAHSTAENAPHHIRTQYLSQHQKALRAEFYGTVLSSGIVMPLLGWTPGKPKLGDDGSSCADAAVLALKAGVRRISLRGERRTDFWIGNVLDHGIFLSALNLKRRDIFVSTVQRSLGREKTIDQFWGQLKWLRTGYVDLLYLEMPSLDPKTATVGHDFPRFLEAWAVLEQISKLSCPTDECEEDLNGKLFKRIRSLGIANAHYKGLQLMMSKLTVKTKPSILYNKFDVYRQGEYFLQKESLLMELCADHKIFIESFSPLSGFPFVMQPRRDPHVHWIASNLRKTPEQVLLRWVLQHGFLVTFSSRNSQHISKNVDVFDFLIPDVWMKRISGLQWLVHSPINRATVEDVYIANSPGT